MGDSLLSAAFVSYAGPFTIPFRNSLVVERWLPDLIQRGIPMTEGFMPLQLLTSDALKVFTALHSCSCNAGTASRSELSMSNGMLQG